MTVLAAPLHTSRVPDRTRPVPVVAFRLPAPLTRPPVALLRPVTPAPVPVTAPAAVPAAVPAPVPAPPAGEPAAGGCWAERIQRGDRAAWTELVARFGTLVTSSARRVVSDPADLDEAVQRTWLAVWQHADAVRDLDRLPGWLRVTARREGLAILRRRRDVLVGDVAVLDRAVSAAPVARSTAPCAASRETAPDSAELVERRQRVDELHAAIDTLPTRQRRLVRALLADTLSYDEISATLGIPRGSIGPMRARALVALRRRLAGWED